MPPPSVLLFYSHDSRARQDRLLDLANRLREDGIDARIDQFEEMEPDRWAQWIRSEAEAADFVLFVPSPRIRSLDVLLGPPFASSKVAVPRPEPIRWVDDGPAIEEMIATLRGLPQVDGRTLLHNYDPFLNQRAACIERFIPVLLHTSDRAYLPEPPCSVPCYDLDSATGYGDLVVRVTGQPPGARNGASLAARVRATDFFRPWFAPFRRPLSAESRPEIADLRRILDERGVATVNGTAGSGKSNLALEYAWAFRDNYTALFWVRSDSARAVQASWKRIAGALDIGSKTVPDWLRANRGWLMVCDDATAFDPSIAHEDGHVLITVRSGSVIPEIQGVTLAPRNDPGVATIPRAMAAREGANLLSLMAFLDSQSIGRDLLAFGTIPGDRATLPDCIEKLTAEGILRADLVSGAVAVPRQVQEAIRAQMSSEARGVWSARAIRVLGAFLPFQNIHEILPHVLECAALEDLWGQPSLDTADLLEKIAQGRPAPPERWKQPLLAEAWIEDDHPGIVELLLRRALAIRSRLLEPNHPEIADLLEILGLRCFEAARYEESTRLHRHALRIREAHLPSSRLDSAISMGELAMCAEQSGQWEESERLWRHAAVMNGLAGARSKTAACLRRLADLYRSRATSLNSSSSA